MSDKRTLVVGTTPDYIAYIDRNFPKRCLFLTDIEKRKFSREIKPDSDSEIVCDLQNSDQVLTALQYHLEDNNQQLSGVACYDCESLVLAAQIAEYFKLPFPSVASIKLSRDKFLTKKKWIEYGVRCPKVELVHSGWQAFRLIEQFNSSVVLKPTHGSGSELVFHCHDNADLSFAYHELRVGLAQRSNSPLYRTTIMSDKNQSDEHPVLAEEFVEGREYSADFIIENNSVQIIRISKKLSNHELPFGTTTAYIIPAKLPEWLDIETLKTNLFQAASSLGFTRAICMVDFMITKKEVVFLELTPRTGGDCLPPLIKHCSGVDTIEVELDFADGKSLHIPPQEQWIEHVGLRLFAEQSGRLKSVDFSQLEGNESIKEIFLKFEVGHEIILPPEDYDSWILGHVIFEPTGSMPLIEECKSLLDKIYIQVEQQYVQKIN